MAASLLELPRDCLIRIVAQLPFAERLQLNRVCRRLRQLCREPSEVWATVEARPTFNPDATTEAVSHWMFALRRCARVATPHTSLVATPRTSLRPAAARISSPHSTARPGLPPCCRWLRLRGGGVEELSVDCRRSDGGRLPHQWALPGSLLPGPVDGVAALPLLRRLIIRFPGRALLSFSSLPALPALNTLWIAHAAITVDSQPPACPSIPPGLDVSLFHGLVGGLMDGPWLPTQTTRLKLLDMQRTALPGCVAHLPRLHRWGALPACRCRRLSTAAPAPAGPALPHSWLPPHLPPRSLDWNANGTLAMASLARLTQTAALAQTLQQLDLGENSLNRFPHEASQRGHAAARRARGS